MQSYRYSIYDVLYIKKFDITDKIYLSHNPTILREHIYIGYNFNITIIYLDFIWFRHVCHSGLTLKLEKWQVAKRNHFSWITWSEKITWYIIPQFAVYSDCLVHRTSNYIYFITLFKFISICIRKKFILDSITLIMLYLNLEF